VPMTLASADDRHLILFARLPLAGATKTRLIPALGPAGAAQLAKRLTEHAAEQARAVGCLATVNGTGGSAAQIVQWLGLPCTLQVEGDLGARMHAAMRAAYASGAARILLIGSDCPGLTADILLQGFEALTTQDVVFGPAVDGGYYLIGLRAPQPQLFEGMAWSHNQVLHDTIARLGRLTYALLPTLHDIDTPDDLALLPPSFLS
jgi:uncharacterized protein